jgi:tRNA A-37 threonylcarbamoyl transferase component Bud32
MNVTADIASGVIAKYALQTLARLLKPIGSKAGPYLNKAKQWFKSLSEVQSPAPQRATPPRPAPKVASQGWAATTGVFKDLDFAGLRDIASRSPRDALKALNDWAASQVAAGRLSQPYPQARKIYVDRAKKVAYWIGDSNELHRQLATAAGNVEPKLGPKIFSSESVFLPIRKMQVHAGQPDVWSGPAVVAMENLPGPTLRQALTGANPAEQRRLTKEVAYQLGRWHSITGGAVHGDTGLDNFLIGNKGEVLLIDFELSHRNRPYKNPELSYLTQQNYVWDIENFTSSLTDALPKGSLDPKELMRLMRDGYFEGVKAASQKAHPNKGDIPPKLEGMRRYFDSRTR